MFETTITALVDAFVDKVNRGPREPQPLAEVPAFLREGEPGEWDSHSSWRIVRSDNSRRIKNLQHRIARRFPPSFLYFLSTYSFPAFECGPLMFFANTGEDTFWELEKRLFEDPHMSPQLLKAGFIQIGNPFFYNYDPVCLDCNPPLPAGRKLRSTGYHEYRIVRVDHEAVLCRNEIRIVEEIAPSFIAYVRRRIASDPIVHDRQ